MKTVLITGGAKRLGLALVSSFLEKGFFVMAHSHTTPFDSRNLSPAASRFAENLSHFSYDLTSIVDAAAAADFLEQASRGKRDIDILINNASCFEYDRPGSLDVDLFGRAMATNLLPPLLLMDAFLRRGDAPKIVINMLDNRVISPNMDHLSYSLSKSALGTATQMYAIAFETTAKIYGIAPSMFLESGPLTVGRVSDLASMTLTRTPVTVEDVVDTVHFCASGVLQTGSITPVDGGQSSMGLKRDVAYLQRDLAK